MRGGLLQIVKLGREVAWLGSIEAHELDAFDAATTREARLAALSAYGPGDAWKCKSCGACGFLFSGGHIGAHCLLCGLA